MMGLPLSPCVNMYMHTCIYIYILCTYILSVYAPIYIYICMHVYVYIKIVYVDTKYTHRRREFGPWLICMAPGSTSRGSCAGGPCVVEQKTTET